MFLFQLFFSGYTETVLGPLATALTTIPIFISAATFSVLAAETVLLKRNETNNCAVLNHDAFKAFSFLLRFLPDCDISQAKSMDLRLSILGQVRGLLLKSEKMEKIR